MSGRHHELQLLLGSYVLGGLSASDRRHLEEHLPGCPECTAELSRFAVVPGLLQLVAGSAVDRDPPAPPADSLPRLLAAVKAWRTRRRRRLLLAAAAAVLVLAGVTGGLWLFTRPEPPPAGTPLVAASAPATSAAGQVILEPKAWGTQIRLTMYYVGGSDSALSAWAVATDGHAEQAATWTTPSDGRCYVIGATSIKRDQLVRVEIRTADGFTVMRTDG